MEDKLYNKFKPNIYFKPDEYLNGWAKKCGWKATLVYDSLWRHSDKNGSSFPSIDLMADEHGVGYNTIRRGLKTLIDFNFVKIEKKRSKAGKFLCNLYTLTDKKDWKDVSIAPTGLRTSIAPTGNIHSPHRADKDTHGKDTHIKYNNAPADADIVEDLLKEEEKKEKIRYPHQYLGLEIFEKTKAPKKKKAECIRLAKIYPQGQIMAALSFSSDYPRPELKWKMFLWKLHQFKKNAKTK